MFICLCNRGFGSLSGISVRFLEAVVVEVWGGGKGILLKCLRMLKCEKVCETHSVGISNITGSN